MASMKNTPLSSAAAGDLGLGDALQNQVTSILDERRKKLLSQPTPGAMGPQAGIGPATMSLFNMSGGLNG